MMSISDILQLIVLCALLFSAGISGAPLSAPNSLSTLRLMFFKPRYVKPAGVLRREATTQQGKLNK
ncbi:cellulose biosynthesis protein BcsF [Raoultella planticola]|nr:cellulose biosynthesis protein BcsF [Raoultella planticola]